jgi:response regulator RpfG family c-di-GMP phosphodiesterase
LLIKYKNPVAPKIIEELEKSKQKDVTLYEVIHVVLKHVAEAYQNLYNTGQVDEKLQVIELMGKRSNMSDDEINKLKIAAMLYDIGNMLTSEEIILKPGPLTKEEKKKVLENPILAAKEILKPIKATSYIINIIENHHEHWDGTGYPGNLSGALIPRGARILFIVNSFFAMINKRPYREPLPFQ